MQFGKFRLVRLRDGIAFRQAVDGGLLVESDARSIQTQCPGVINRHVRR